MYVEKPSVLENCSESTKTALELYCNYINRSRAEVFIVMAQKAFCLFWILLEEGLIHKDITTRFYSSAALEFGYSDFERKKVAIVDDIIISGSAIAAVAYKLWKYGKVSDVDLEIIALARDLDYQTMQFTTIEDGKSLLKCAVDVKDAECIEMSYEVSHILAYRGRPYSADFPAYHKFEIDRYFYRDILNSPEWETYDVTNDVQNDGNVRAITIFPRRAIQNKLWRLLGIDLSEFLHLKIRCYIQHYECERDIMEIVPMALFHEISENDIDELIFHFVSQGVSVIQKVEKSHYYAKLRILQFYIAHALKTAFYSVINSNECDLIPEIICQTFGSLEAGNIVKCLENIVEKNDIKHIPKKELKIDDRGYKARFQCDTLWENDDEKGMAINQALYQAIQDRYEKEELSARENLKSPIKHFLLDYEEIEIELERLHKGFSLNALKEIIEDADNVYYLEQLVSLFVDRGVDEGIVVPTIYYNEKENYVGRVYRHGEDLPFGDADKSRILCFLNHFDAAIRELNGNKEEKLSSIVFEKIIILFYQIGMKKKYRIFNRFLGFDNYPVLQQRFSVHGAIATYKENDTLTESHIYLEGKDQNVHMLNIFLRQNGNCKYISSQDNKETDYYTIQSDNIKDYLRKSRLNNISGSIDDNIQRIASVIGSWYWYEHQKTKNSFKDDITALTSCKNIYTYASAVATSIHYFKEYWEGEAKNKLIQIQQGDGNKNFYSEKLDPVLPSGRDKHEWFAENRASKVIEKVNELLNENGMQENRRIWNDFWSGESYIFRGDNLRDDANMATQYIYFYSACYEGLRQQWFLKDDAQDSFLAQSENAKKYLEQCKAIETERDDVINQFKLFDSILENKSQSDRIEKLLDRMDGIIFQSEEIVEKIEEGIRESSATYRIQYTSVMFVDIELQKGEMADEFFLKIWEDLRETEEKTLINIIAFGVIDGSYFRYGIFHEKHEREAIKYLLDIYGKVHSYACKYASKTRAILLPMLRGSWVFNHDLKSNTVKNAKDFDAKVSLLTSQIQFRNNVHQFYYIRTWNTSDDIYNEVSKYMKDYEELEGKQSIKVPSIGMDYECYQFVCGNSINMSKLNYSTVSIEVNNQHKGTGLLFCYEEEIYCVTCQHLLGAGEFSGNVEAIVDCIQQRIHLEPMNHIIKTDRTAWEDILILKPQIDRLPELDRKYMFHVEDCIEQYSESLSEDNYKLYGFGVIDPSYGRLVRNIKLIGEVRKYYYQMKGTEELGFGDSGAGIISDKTSKLLGIHAKSLNNEQAQTLMIPAWIVLDTLGRNYNKRR